MKRVLSGMVLVISLCFVISARPGPLTTASTTVGDEARPAGLPSAAGWSLAFDDCFNQPWLNLNTWNIGLPWGRVNRNELQFYADDAFDLVSNPSHVLIRAEPRPMEGRPYTSGALHTRGRFSFQYGYAEIMVKVPKGKGLWPAFWLLAEGDDWPPEIDVFEIIGDQPNTVYMTNHWKSPSGEHLSTQGIYTGPDFSAGFHTFAVDWRPGEVIWYVDGIERYRTNQGVPAEPMYLIVNLAIGGDWPGNPDASTLFPAQMDIHYIRAYQRVQSASASQVYIPLIKNAAS